ncbi:MAG: alanine dehydrogenase [Candidatus Nitrosotenuis sp.]|nr:MAG: alanine dehydrogenase [Candidatus Nitrosotenuis sp.]
MIIGVPREIKADEYRVGLAPAGARSLVQAGHTVLVEKGAGEGSGFADSAYAAEGAEIADAAPGLWARADMVVKVKEPVIPEFDYMREGQILYTFLHLAADKTLTERLLEKKIVGVAYETVRGEGHSLPLLVPMSEIAGRMAVQEGAKYLEKANGGRGVLLGGVPGVAAARVTILGGGVVGANAAKIAVGMGARVRLLDKSLERLRYLDDIFGGRLETIYANPLTIRAATREADLLIGAVLIPGAKAPRLVTREMVSEMKQGAVIVDVSVDQGGCVETSRPTTHHSPTFVVDGVLHYCVANMPGAVPRTSTLALTSATFPYAFEIAQKGITIAVRDNPLLRPGVNVHRGHLTCEEVAQSLDLKYTPLEI